MKLDTYKSLDASGTFLSVASGTDIERVSLPKGRALVKFKLLRSGYELPDDAANPAFAKSIFTQIFTSGHAVHGPDVALYEYGGDKEAR